MARLDELWRAAGGPGVPPGLDRRRVKARVNAALDADQTERKIYMKQKLRTALMAAAVAAALTCSAFAATTGWTGLSSWFKGDPAPVREYMDNTVRSVSDENYTLTVEGMVSDESAVYLTAAITALSDEAKEFLWDEHFRSMDTFEVWVPEQDSNGPTGHLRPVGFGNTELKADEENTRRFALEVDDLPYSVNALYVWCGYMEKGRRIEVPMTPAPSRTVKIGASGKGVVAMGSTTLPEPEVITIDEITLSSLTLHIKGGMSYGTAPNVRLRTADGTVFTQAQLMTQRSGRSNEFTGQWERSYRFKEVQDLDDIVSFIVFDMEYPVDGSKPTPVEHNPSLDPIVVSRMKTLREDTGYTLPVRELTEKLGGTCEWNPATGDVTCTYRGLPIVFHAGKDTALVDGKPVDLLCAPAEQNGVLAADWDIFTDAWGIDGFVQREYIRNEEDPMNSTIIWGDWYIIP